MIDRIGRYALGRVRAAGRLGHFLADLARAVPDVATWRGPLVVQMRKIGVDSLPVALFIAEDLPDTEDQAMDRFLSDEIESALNTLQRRDAKVLRLYFGLDGGREHTLEEIGGMLGVTRERVRQLRDRALKRLREGDVGKALASFAA